MKWTEGHIWKATIAIRNPEFSYKHIAIQQNNWQWEDGIDRQVNLTNSRTNREELKAIWNHMKITFLLYSPSYYPSKHQMKIKVKIPELDVWKENYGQCDMKLSKKLYSYHGKCTSMWKKTLVLKMNDFPKKFQYRYCERNKNTVSNNELSQWEIVPSRQFVLSTPENMTSCILLNNRVIKQDTNFVTGVVNHMPLEDSQSNPPSIARYLLIYFAGICTNGWLVQRQPYACKNHINALFSCKICQGKSKIQKYRYQCSECKNYFCVIHYLRHILLFSFCITNDIGINCTTEALQFQNGNACIVSIHRFHQFAFNLPSAKLNFTSSINPASEAIVTNICHCLKANSFYEISNTHLIRPHQH